MRSIYKKVGTSLLGLAVAGLCVQYISQVNAEEFIYHGCSATEANSGDFQSLDNCGLLTHTAWCNVNSGAINISYDECVSLANLYEETNGYSWTYNSGWFTSTDVSTWQGAALYGDNFGVIISGGHVTDLQLLGNNLNGDIVSGLNNLSYMTRLVLNFNNINSINLSHNTGLRSLYIGYNPISSIDVSANTALQFIYINSSNISSIDVSANTNLQDFWAGSTPFTGVDLSHNPYIKTIKLDSTDIQSIDVSSYTGLEDLGLSNTSITGVDLTHNTALKYLQLNGDTGIQYLDLSPNAGLIELELHDMALTGIDLSNLSVLRYLNVDHNQLGSLDVSDASALQQLSAIDTNLSYIDLSHNPLLTSLSLADNHLAELDISHNTDLWNLNASNNELYTLTVSGAAQVYHTGATFTLDSNALCSGTGNMTEYTFLTTYAPTWNTTQYCHIRGVYAYNGDQSLQITWHEPKDYGFLHQLSGYYSSADFMTGADFTTGLYIINSHTYSGLTNGHTYTFTICAVYSDGQLTRCTNIQATPSPATPYVLSEVTPVAPVVTSTSVRYSFYVAGNANTIGETVVSDCGWGSDILAEATTINSGMSIEISNLQAGKTYECDVFLRSIPGMEESNHLHIGPFRVAHAGGGGGGGSAIIDSCPNGDHSGSYYDDDCGDSTTQNNTSLPIQAITGSCTDAEYNAAYVFAFKYHITTMPSCLDANMDGSLTRAQAAKMMSNYAINVLAKSPDNSKACVFSDMADQSPEMQQYAIAACRLGIMGLETDGITPSSQFNPNDLVDKAQFATILDRLINGRAHDGNTTCWYCDHVSALQDAGVITITTDLFDPLKRSFAMIMLMRSKKNIYSSVDDTSSRTDLR